MTTAEFINRLKKEQVYVKADSGRLIINADEDKLTQRLVAELQQRKEELIGFLEDFSRASIYEDIKPVEKREYYPQSSAQERLFFLDHFENVSTSYNMTSAFSIQGGIDREKFAAAFEALLARHEILRTSFFSVDGKPVQKVHHPGEIKFEIEYYEVGNRREASGISEEKAGNRQQAIGEKAAVGEKKEDSSQENYAHSHTSDMSYMSHLIPKFIRSFDLSKAPLLRAALVEISAQGFLLLFDIHHIIGDGASIGILIDDFVQLYEGETLLPQKLQYKDFSTWQNNLLTGGKIKAQEEYWLNLYRDADEIPVLDLPGDFPRPAVFTFAGDHYKFKLETGTAYLFKKFCSGSGATLYMGLMAVLNILLHKYTGQDEMVVGIGIMGRSHADLQDVVGMFVNSLAIRNRIEAGQTCVQLLEAVRENSIAAFQNQHVQFENLVERINPQRDSSRNPVFDVTLAVENYEAAKRELKSFKVAPYPTGKKSAKFDLTFFINEVGDEISIGVEYYTGIFKEKTIHRLAGHFVNIVRQVVQEPRLKITGIDILTAEEKQQVLVDFNDTETPYPADKTIYELFAEQVEKFPYGIALVGPAVQPAEKRMWLTYSELESRVDRLGRLLSAKGVGPGVIVALLAERSVEMICGIMAILKSGAAYLPIELDFPPGRVMYMLADSGARLLLSTGNLRQAVDELAGWQGEILLIEEKEKKGDRLKKSTKTEVLQGCRGQFFKSAPCPPEARNNNLAYVIYTSGTTGKPKGVLTMQYNVSRVVKNTDYIHIEPQDRFLQLSNYAFDGSVFDIYGALLNGAALVLAEKETVLAVDQLAALIKQEKVTVFFITSALFNTLVDFQIDCFTHTRKIVCGGERVSVEHARKALAYLGKGRIINGYGPTESTVFAACHPIDEIDGAAASIPIGKPIANTTIYILDKNLKPVPIGISGEMFIGGAGLARGYLNSPELTSEKFKDRSDRSNRANRSYKPYMSYKKYKTGEGAAHLPSESGAGQPSPITSHLSPATLYRTGDLARWLPDGSIEFLGRMDHQVKIRGFRIELGEIETRLLRHNRVEEAVVLAIEEQEIGDKYLCAYIVPAPGAALETAALREFLSVNLPGYMIPGHFVFLERFPLTGNGKIDKKRLPHPETDMDSNEYMPPTNELESRLVAIWADVLNLEKETIGIDMSFFDLGGHSLKATSLVSLVQKELDIKIPLAEIFKTPTVRGLASFISAADWVGRAKAEPGTDTGKVEELFI